MVLFRNKGKGRHVLTDAKLAEVKALCDAEDAKPEHEKRFNGYTNPLGLKQPTWRRYVMPLSYLLWEYSVYPIL